MNKVDILNIFLVIALVVLIGSYKVPLGIGVEMVLIFSGVALIGGSISYYFENKLTLARIFAIVIGANNVVYAIVKIHRREKHKKINL